ncbi:MAG: DUF72 domain-containing protein, partial [Acidobacteriaceae bacterium]
LETPDVVTAPFTCYRRRKSDYTEAQLAEIRDQLLERAAQGDVFAHFKHEEDPAGALHAMAVLESVRERSR